MKSSPIHWLVCREQHNDGFSAVDESIVSSSIPIHSIRTGSDSQLSRVRLTNCHLKQPQRNGISSSQPITSPHSVRLGNLQLIEWNCYLRHRIEKCCTLNKLNRNQNHKLLPQWHYFSRLHTYFSILSGCLIGMQLSCVNCK